MPLRTDKPLWVRLGDDRLLWGPDDMVEFLARYGEVRGFLKDSSKHNYDHGTVYLSPHGDRSIDIMACQFIEENSWMFSVWTTDGDRTGEVLRTTDLLKTLKQYLELTEKK
jgi:hypothetical protein